MVAVGVAALVRAAGWRRHQAPLAGAASFSVAIGIARGAISAVRQNRGRYLRASVFVESVQDEFGGQPAAILLLAGDQAAVAPVTGF